MNILGITFLWNNFVEDLHLTKGELFLKYWWVDLLFFVGFILCITILSIGNGKKKR